MKLSRNLHFISSVLLLAACGDASSSTVQDQSELVGGIVPREGQFPSVIYLANEAQGVACTGTKVGPRHVLTAAHCLGRGLRPLLRDGVLPPLEDVMTGSPFSLSNAVAASSRFDGTFFVAQTYFPVGWKEACERWLEVASDSDTGCGFLFQDDALSTWLPDAAVIVFDRPIVEAAQASVASDAAPGIGQSLLAAGYGRRFIDAPAGEYGALEAAGWVFGSATGDGTQVSLVASPIDQRGAGPFPAALRWGTVVVEAEPFRNLRDGDWLITRGCTEEQLLDGRDSCVVHHAGDSGAPLFRRGAPPRVVVAVHSGAGRVPDNFALHTSALGQDVQNMLRRAGVRPTDPSIVSPPLQYARTRTLRLPTVSSQNWEMVAAVRPSPLSTQTLLYWRNTSGGNVAWILEDGVRTGQIVLPRLADPAWTIVDVSDADGDGEFDDIYWRNTETGANVIWMMEGGIRVRSVGLPSVRTLWNMVAIGDADGDGDNDDIYWRNTQTGANTVWLMDGARRIRSLGLPRVQDLEWRMVDVGDVRGDGTRDDIFWRHTSTGQNIVWLMDGNIRLDQRRFPGVPNQDWSFVAVEDIQNDGTEDDIFWRNTANGTNIIWLTELRP